MMVVNGRNNQYYTYSDDWNEIVDAVMMMMDVNETNSLQTRWLGESKPVLLVVAVAVLVLEWSQLLDYNDNGRLVLNQCAWIW